MDAADWDSRYADSDFVWGGEPNRFIATELGPLTPGRALDIACGEGRNAIWLATLGWFVVGIDFSRTAIERAQRLAEQAGVSARTEFIVGDVVAGPLPAGVFDAVVIAYLHVPPDQRRHITRQAANRVAPGGRLLVVGHDSTNLTDGVGGPQDPALLFTPTDVTYELPIGFVVDKADQVYRDVATPSGERTAIDALVLAHRPEGDPTISPTRRGA